MKRALAALTLTTALLLPASAARACPNCKEAVAAQTDESAGRLKDGYYYSILMMVGMPFTLLGTGAFFVARAVKRGVLPEF